MIIYKTINKINNKIYIGKDVYNNPNYLGSGKMLKKAIKKYGKENFKKEIIESCDDEQKLSNREIYWIDKLNATDNNIGYNIAIGGSGGWLGEKVNEKRKKSLTGRKFSDNHRKNLSKSLSGRKLSEDHHKKIVESRRNNGRPWASENWKKVMKEIMKGNDYGKNNKGQFQPKNENGYATVVYEIKIPNGDLIKIVTRNNLDKFAKQINENKKRGKKFRVRELIDIGESKGYLLINKYKPNKMRENK